MEKMVLSPDIDKILIICDKGYQEKANENKGGVGTEKLLITPEVFSNVEQTKVIPIIAERDENGNEYIPNFIKSRIYIDLSNEDSFEENYEKLVRTIYDAPLYRKPPLGKRPVFLDEESVNNYRTTNLIRQINRALESNPTRIKGLIRRFVDAFLEELEQLKLTYEDLNVAEKDDKIVEKINASLPLRDDYAEFINLLSENDKITGDLIVDFFEKIYPFSEFRDTGTYYEIQNDQYKFLIHELFIYTCGILLKHNHYDTLSEVLHSKYFIESKYRNFEANFDVFRFYLHSLEARNNRLRLGKISLHAQILIERINKKFLSKQDLLNCDLLLFYLSVISVKTNHLWFPLTYIYKEYDDSFKFLNKLKSARVAERAFKLFNVSSIDELREKVRSYTHDSGVRYNNGGHSAPSIHSYIKPDEIGILP